MPFKLTREQEADIERSLRSLYDIETDMGKAEDCGVECVAHRLQAKRLRKTLEEYRKQFGKEVGA